MKYLFAILCSCLSCLYSCDMLTSEDKLKANAGTDQTIIAGSYAVFNPTNSEGDYGWYDWQQDENNPQKVNIYPGDRQQHLEANIHKISFVKEGVYRFKLIVRSGVTPSNYNGSSYSEPDELIITVESNPYSKFEDLNLEAIIRAKLNRQIGELDENILLNLDSLSYAEVIPVQKITSLKGLEGCKNLTYLKMGSQDISDISPLASLTKLKVLALDQNRKINDITALSELTELEWLNLDDNLIKDISPLENLIKLKYLNLQLNMVVNIDAIKNMNELETLLLFRASLVDISALSNLITLKQLWIIDSELNNISSLANLTEIKNLHLAWNQIKDISFLSNMKKLEWLALEKNNITDISSLRDVQNLKYVRLWDNQITDIKPLVDNLGIGKGDIVGLNGNSLDGKSKNEYIPALQARGVEVTWE